MSNSPSIAQAEGRVLEHRARVEREPSKVQYHANALVADMGMLITGSDFQSPNGDLTAEAQVIGTALKRESMFDMGTFDRVAEAVQRAKELP